MNLFQYLLGRENFPGATHDEALASVPTEEEVNRAHVDLTNYQSLLTNPGWKALIGEMGEWADECLNRWTAGGLTFQETERLAATIDTLKRIIALPAQLKQQAEATIEEAAELERTTQEPDSILTDPEEGYL